MSVTGKSSSSDLQTAMTRSRLTLNCDGPGVFFHDLPVAIQIFRRIIAHLFALNGHEFEIREAVHNFGQPAVKEDFAMINDDDASQSAWISAM